jgi:UDP-GlcNAc:undecaprenyl-phosphate GlcNAc-1-phosphate transferase
MIAPILCLCGVSFILSWLFTAAMKRIAPRVGFVDKPGHRKIHVQPKPLGGGVAIFWAYALPVAGVLVASWFIHPQRSDWAASVGGIKLRSSLAWAILGCTLFMHVLGLIDDKKALGPYLKLAAQLAITAVLVVGFNLRILTALGPVASVVLSILWITAITNAFNFLDNMDGLSAGVAAVCTAAFLVTALSIGQWFVAANLSLLLGTLLGFLCFNFSPATIFMGDSGSLIIGFLLGVLTVRTTFLPTGTQLAAGWYSLFAPIIVLALPLYDLIVVSIIRLNRGKSPFVGDTNHFSHRLVARGMSRRTAVLCIYLVTAATAISAMLLPHVQSTFAVMLILIQTLLVLGVVALLEQHSLPMSAQTTTSPSPIAPQADR